MNRKVALITGISGQDGSYLAEYLLRLGYQIIGLTRDPEKVFRKNIAHLEGKIEFLYSSYEPHSLRDILETYLPTEVYNLAGQTYVGKSWEMIDETFQASGLLPCHFLEAIVKVNPQIRFFQASSSEIFCPQEGQSLTEDSPISPYNPYGCSKAFGHNMVSSYRRNYGIYAVSGILFNHESSRRNENFVSKKIIKKAVRIKLGIDSSLALGNLEVSRDWGYAPDYVEAMHLMMSMPTPQDILICSGKARSVRQLVSTVFEILGLDYKAYVSTDNTFYRRFEPQVVVGSNEKAKNCLSWVPKTSFEQMLESMVNSEMQLYKNSVERNYRYELSL